MRNIYPRRDQFETIDNDAAVGGGRQEISLLLLVANGSDKRGDILVNAHLRDVAIYYVLLVTPIRFQSPACSNV
jgi:hypothetical protein